MIYRGVPKPGTGNLSSLLPSSSSFLSLPLISSTGLSVNTAKFTSSSTVSSASFFWLLPVHSLIHPASSPPGCSSICPSLLFIRHNIPGGIPTFLTAATAFIPSNIYGRRAYKSDSESNKSDNAPDFRRVYKPDSYTDNRQRIDFTGKHILSSRSIDRQLRDAFKFLRLQI